MLAEIRHFFDGFVLARTGTTANLAPFRLNGRAFILSLLGVS
jgi:hypothetical protein